MQERQAKELIHLEKRILDGTERVIEGDKKKWTTHSSSILFQKSEKCAFSPRPQQQVVSQERNWDEGKHYFLSLKKKRGEEKSDQSQPLEMVERNPLGVPTTRVIQREEDEAVLSRGSIAHSSTSPTRVKHELRSKERNKQASSSTTDGVSL